MSCFRHCFAWAKKNPNATKVTLDFGTRGRPITDVGAQALASACPNLTSIHLSYAQFQVTDVGVQALASACPNLTEIWLRYTQATDVGAQALADACPNLTFIKLGTQVTDAAKQQMRAKFPKLSIDY